MRAFEKIQSGLPEMDRAFDSIRLGDNVVLQVGSLEEFKLFAVPFARQAAADGRRLLYIRFASHPPLIEDIPGLEVRTVELSHQFETFTMEIRRIIEEAGLKGMRIGDAEVSPMHGNFIVNRGKASAAEIIALIDLVRKRVYETTGHLLETEVRIIGE